MGTLDLGDSLAPLGFGGSWNDRKIRGARGLSLIPAQPAATCSVPDGNVQYEFPDAVRVRQRSGRGRYCVHTVEKLHQRRSMPGRTIERPSKLVGNAGGFCGWHLLLYSHGSISLTWLAISVSVVLEHSSISNDRNTGGIGRLSNLGS